MLTILLSCGSHKNAVHSRKKQPVVLVEPKPEKIPSVNELKHIRKLEKNSNKLNKYTLKYIRRFAPIAVREMHLYKIPASITLAQGVLESGSGKSELALKSNNHFGIKCHTDWTGERVYHDDDKRGECFRKYQYPETSYDDHSAFLTQRKRYAFLFSYRTGNFKKWAKGLKHAGYATDRKYPSKLIKIIEDYKLYEFDKIKKGEIKYPHSISKNTKRTRNHSVVYEVKKGDTLYSISKKFSTSVAFLKKQNNLMNNTISIGQKMIIK